MDEGPVFELEIERVRTRFRVRVRRSPAGARRWKTFSLPADDVVSLVLASSRTRHLLADDLPRQADSPKDFGRRLFEAVFTGPVLTAWRVATEGKDVLLRLRLDDDPRLLKVPWELLFDPEERTFLATERRVVRSLDLPETRLLKIPSPLRILVVLSSPPALDRLDTEKEWDALDGALGEKVQLKVVPPRLDEIDLALNSGEWHVLHFVGHGGNDEEGGFLVLEDRNGEARSVDHLRLKRFLSHPTLRLVLLNACEGGVPSGEDAFSGVAQALLKGGVPAVLAMQQVISDSAAISFAKHFYGAIGRSLTLGSSVLEARQALYRDGEPEWAVPVLYMRTPDERLINPSIPEGQGEEKRASWWPPPTAAAVGVLLLAFLIWLLVGRPDPPTDEICEIPRGAEENPKECPSPEGLNMAFVRIDPGIFSMGQLGGSNDDEPVHQVRISRPFCIGVYEVTKEQWDLASGSPPPTSKDRYLPARGINYDQALDFLRLLNAKDPAQPYRLLTEAEWEYVARGKMNTTYNFLSDASALVHHANCGEEGDRFDGLACVGQFPPNGWGVHDMYGNVFEWVSDWYGDYSGAAVEDPMGPLDGERRIRRGGSWKSGAEACSSAARSAVKPNRRSEETGFRIVREIR